MHKESYEHQTINSSKYRFTLSWTAVMTGALVATGLGFLLSMFSIGIGMTVVDNTQDGVQTVVIGGLIGLAIGWIVIMFVAGWVSGLLSRHCCLNEHVGVLHGFTTWCLALIISLLLFSPHMNSITPESGALTNSTSSNSVAQMMSNQNPTLVNNPSADRYVSPRTEKVTNAIGVGVLVTFALYFLGAVSASFGGYFGAGVRNKDYNDRDQVNTVDRTTV